MAASAPWTFICKLAGALGGVGTQAAQLVDEISGPRSDASQRAYEDALKAALDPYSREEGPAG